ncbi:hypothetical protein SDC9_109654 [bioreactor metagenome]|uniref:Uncharacterized protein n=1 Tax=bioreactor metagenome TaxID=1076179 RepID=A0A645BCF6_9ZZZZ|nr:hypothetical protein [Aminivibrio sp.]MEA4952724.1 hypothetical protein [Aminivibrio sp.]
MKKARRFLDALVKDGVHVCISLGQVKFSGPEDRVSEAYGVLAAVPSLAGKIQCLFNPTPEDMRAWLDSQDKKILEEYAARVDRLKAAGIPDAESVSLETTYHDHNSLLPERLQPIVVRDV